MIKTVKSDEIILCENIIKALEELYEDINPFTDKEEWKKLIWELLDKEIKYEWHDLRKNVYDVPKNWCDNVMTIDTDGQISIHGHGYSAKGRAGGVMTAENKKGERFYIDETWNDVFNFSQYDSFTHIIAWRYIEPFEEE